MDLNKNIDLKNEIITADDYTFIIFIRDVTEVTPENFASTQTLIQELTENNMNFVVLTGSLQQETEIFNKEYDSTIYFYYSDVTPLKTALRNNLGVILLKEGYVIDKWSYRDIPSLEKFNNSIEKYEENLKKYKIKNPPILPKIEEEVIDSEVQNNEI